MFQIPRLWLFVAYPAKFIGIRLAMEAMSSEVPQTDVDLKSRSVVCETGREYWVYILLDLEQEGSLNHFSSCWAEEQSHEYLFQFGEQ